MGSYMKCLTCGKVITSKHRHDFQGCACEPGSATSIFIDGGDDYCRGGYGKDAKWEWVSAKELSGEEGQQLELPLKEVSS